MENDYYPVQEERQIPFRIKYDTRSIWDEIKLIFQVDATGAAIIVAAYEAFFVGRPVSYSRNKAFYGPHRHMLMKYQAVIRAVDHLAIAGWITHYRQSQGCRDWQSAFEATPKLIDAVQDILEGKSRLPLLRPCETTILRDLNGAQIQHKGTREIARRDRKTERFNEGIMSANVQLRKMSNVIPFVNLACPIARIHNRTFDRGGRFYARGASWQNIKSEARRRLTIDGEQVVELDFDGMHISMLYAEANLPLPSGCYDIHGWPRRQVKVATLTLINAKSEHSARLSIAHDLIAPPGTQDAIKKAQVLIDLIKKKHHAIADQFHNDTGARLMRNDSDIAENVMVELILRKGIVVLPVHDSFVVPASKHDELKVAMIEAAFRITGANLTVSRSG